MRVSAASQSNRHCTQYWYGTQWNVNKIHGYYWSFLSFLAVFAPYLRNGETWLCQNLISTAPLKNWKMFICVWVFFYIDTRRRCFARHTRLAQKSLVPIELPLGTASWEEDPGTKVLFLRIGFFRSPSFIGEQVYEDFSKCVGGVPTSFRCQYHFHQWFYYNRK